MLAAQGGHTVLLDLVREPSTHSKVANITDQVMTQHVTMEPCLYLTACPQVLSTIVEHGLLPQDEVIKHRKVFASF